MASSSIPSKKVFGYCKVKWQIHNFFLQATSNEWTIKSPEFTVKGSEETNWCMDLRPTRFNGSQFVLFSLTRSFTDSGPKYIWLNLKIHCICSEIKPVCCNSLLAMKNGSKREVYLGSIEYLLTELGQLIDSFTLVCDMIVYNKSKNNEFGDCINPGVKLLSENLFDLYNSAQNFDTKLVFNDNIILAHESILCARNSYLSSLILDHYINAELEEVQEYTTLNFTNILDYKAMRNILAYFYTGDIRHVLQEPSFAIHHCATFLGIREISEHYKPEELILKSNIDFKEHSYVLRGFYFEKSRFVWNFDQVETVNKYRLYFFPEGDYSENFLQLFAREFQSPITVCFILKFSDKYDHICTASFIIKKHVSVDIDKIISGVVRRLNSTNKIFEVVVNLKISSGVNISYVDEHIAVSVKPVSQDFYYYRLASDMNLLLRHRSLPDLMIISSDSFFWIHKCILASRSSYFLDMFKERNEVVVSLSIEPFIFYAALVYIYTGSLKITGSSFDNIKLYKAAIFLNLPHLKSICTDRMIASSITHTYIRCSIVRVAEEHEDDNLKKSVLRHIFDENDRIIEVSHNLAFLQDSHVCWFCS